MTTSWDINTATYNGKYPNVGTLIYNAERIRYLENDNKIYKGPTVNQ